MLSAAKSETSSSAPYSSTPTPNNDPVCELSSSRSPSSLDQVRILDRSVRARAPRPLVHVQLPWPVSRAALIAPAKKLAPSPLDNSPEAILLQACSDGKRQIDKLHVMAQTICPPSFTDVLQVRGYGSERARPRESATAT